MTQVVNKDNDEYDVYCGRCSIFGNPYEIGIDGTRAQVIERYKKWFNFCLRDPIFKREVLNLQGKSLGCFCKPLACHCDVIKEWLDRQASFI